MITILMTSWYSSFPSSTPPKRQHSKINNNNNNKIIIINVEIKIKIQWNDKYEKHQNKAIATASI